MSSIGTYQTDPGVYLLLLVDLTQMLLVWIVHNSILRTSQQHTYEAVRMTIQNKSRQDYDANSKGLTCEEVPRVLTILYIYIYLLIPSQRYFNQVLLTFVGKVSKSIT